MIGLVFGKPQSRALRRRWNALEAMRTALFSQLIVVPLFHRHGILTQVAADNMNVVKLLPPLIAGEEEVDYFVDALDDVLGAAAARLGAVLGVRPDDGQGRPAPVPGMSAGPPTTTGDATGALWCSDPATGSRSPAPAGSSARP